MKLDFHVLEQLMVNIMNPKKIALLSVYDKVGIVEFAEALIELGWHIISSGGTAKVLSEAGVSVQDVAEFTGRGAILDHRVVTLDPAIHGGLLATEDMRAELEDLGFPWIDLVCVDLYPLKNAIADPKATTMSVIDQTDIGGPTMLRSAAKGRRIVIADPNDRDKLLSWLRNGKPDEEVILTQLAAKVEEIIADYCLASARFHSKERVDGMIGTRVTECKYGENGWQQPAGLYTVDHDPLSLANFQLKNDRNPGFVNWCDVDRLLQTITHIAAAFYVNTGSVPFIAIAAKHGNACGASISTSPIEALTKMIDGDRLSIFGGVVMTNFPISQSGLSCLRMYGTESGHKRFLAGIVAPEICGEALEELKKSNCFLLENKALNSLTDESLERTPIKRQVRGGFLRQPNFTFVLKMKEIDCLGELTHKQERDILLGWAIGSTSNSNTVTLVRDGALLANGTGQQDRVMAADLAIRRAKRSEHDITGAIAYSDSFFPFPDGAEVLTNAGVSVIFASSGSRGDAAVKEHCANAGVTLCMMPDATCRGFYGH